MPQMIVEYSDNIQKLDQQALMLQLNHALFETRLVQQPHDIKTRIRANGAFLIGFGQQADLPEQAYIHVRLAVLTGRSEAQRQQMTDALAESLQSFQGYEAQGLVVQLCVELTEMPRQDYQKISVQH